MKDPGEILKKLSQEEPSKQVVDTLITLVQEFFNEIKKLELTVQTLKDEITNLKNLPPRPKIEPSRLEKDSKTDAPNDRKKNWSKGSKNDKLIIDEKIEIAVDPEKIPKGSIFKGHRKYIVQDLVITKKVTQYLLAQWQKPDGTYIAAELPIAVRGSHFGPGLRQYIVHQHNANRVPQNRIMSDLDDKGIKASEGQLNAILAAEAAKLQTEKENILAAGLEASCVQTDDTGTRHKKKNGFATVICNLYFAYFKSSEHKSRINFLEILSANNPEYRLTPVALDYIMGFNPAQSTIAFVEKNANAHFANKNDWEAFLQKHYLGKDTQRMLTEGALIGALIASEKITLDIILMSDAAGQFNLFKHVLCWIHIERSIKRLIPLNDKDRQEIDSLLSDFWDFYRSLKAFKKSLPDEQALLKPELVKRFDEIFNFPATEIPLTQALKKIRAQKSQLLLVLDHPTIPLHNNVSEGDIREYVTKRKVSGGTRSDYGRDARDIFISLYKTCKKLGISFWDYLEDRINQTNNIKPLSELIREKINIAKAAQPAAGP